MSVFGLVYQEANWAESWYDTFDGPYGLHIWSAIKSDNYKGQNSHLLQQNLGYSSMAIE